MPSGPIRNLRAPRSDAMCARNTRRENKPPSGHCQPHSLQRRRRSGVFARNDTENHIAILRHERHLCRSRVRMPPAQESNWLRKETNSATRPTANSDSKQNADVSEAHQRCMNHRTNRRNNGTSACARGDKHENMSVQSEGETPQLASCHSRAQQLAPESSTRCS